MTLIKELKAIAVSERAIETGRIVSKQGGSFYKVSIGRQTLSIRSLISEKLSPGKYVAIAKIKKEYFIISGEDIRSHRKQVIYARG